MQRIPTFYQKTKTTILGWYERGHWSIYHRLDRIDGHIFDLTGIVSDFVNNNSQIFGLGMLSVPRDDPYWTPKKNTKV
jgi:hypothetical protein